MEEQKNNKEVKKDSQEKLSYENLNDVAVQLSKDNQYLKAQLQGAQRALSTLSRLDYLFRIVELSDKNIFPTDFIGKCVKEITKIMTPPEKPEGEAKED